jgi:hypothetical protein
MQGGIGGENANIEIVPDFLKPSNISLLKN